MAMTEISVTEIQEKLHTEAEYVLLDKDIVNDISARITDIYMQTPPDEDPLEPVKRGIKSDEELTEIFDANDINEINIMFSDGSLSINIDRDLSKIGPYDADKVVDAYYSKLGRVASNIAEMAINGEKIALVNIENSIRTGSEEDLMAEYRQRRSNNSDSGPYYPKQPDRIAKRAIRGMLPYKTKSGRKAFKRVRLYIGNPYDGNPRSLSGEDPIDRVDHIFDKNFMTLGDIAKKLGANPRWE